MTRRPSAYEYEDRRNARIRALREQREGPMRRRRRVQPLLLLLWIGGTIALLGSEDGGACSRERVAIGGTERLELLDRFGHLDALGRELPLAQQIATECAP